MKERFLDSGLGVFLIVGSVIVLISLFLQFVLASTTAIWIILGTIFFSHPFAIAFALVFTFTLLKVFGKNSKTADKFASIIFQIGAFWVIFGLLIFGFGHSSTGR